MTIAATFKLKTQPGITLTKRSAAKDRVFETLGDLAEHAEHVANAQQADAYRIQMNSRAAGIANGAEAANAVAALSAIRGKGGSTKRQRLFADRLTEVLFTGWNNVVMFSSPRGGQRWSGALLVASAQSAYVPSVAPIAVAVLACDGGALGAWSNKCRQVAVAKIRRGRWRRDALRCFERECANDAFSGETGDGPESRQNVVAVETWLRRRKTFVWVHATEDTIDFMQVAQSERWALGDAVGVCVGAVVWCMSGHVIRVARGWSALRGVALLERSAPWMRSAAGARVAEGKNNSVLAGPSVGSVNERRGGDFARSAREGGECLALPGPQNPRYYCFMNASAQALFAIPSVRAAARVARQRSPAEWGGRSFAERGDAAQRAGGEPDFDGLLAQTLVEMELGSSTRPIKLEAIPRVFYNRCQEDADEFLQELLQVERARDVCQVFRMEKVERLVRARPCCGGVRKVRGDTELTCLKLHIPKSRCKDILTVQDVVGESSRGDHMVSEFRWECPKECGCAEATKYWCITKTPPCLWVQLLAQTCDAVTRRVKKIRHMLRPCESLVVSGQKFKLVSCVFHHGEGFHGGHYNACCLRAGATGARWEMRDGCSVRSSAPPSHVQGWKTREDSTVHFLMYVREETATACDSAPVGVVRASESSGANALASIGGGGLGGASADQHAGGLLNDSWNDCAVESLQGTGARRRDSAMEAVGARPGRPPAVRMLPGDLFAPVRVLREADFRALRILHNQWTPTESWTLAGAGFAPAELLGHLKDARGDAEPATRVLKEEWVQEWAGRRRAQEVLCDALEGGEKRQESVAGAVGGDIAWRQKPDALATATRARATGESAPPCDAVAGRGAELERRRLEGGADGVERPRELSGVLPPAPHPASRPSRERGGAIRGFESESQLSDRTSGRIKPRCDGAIGGDRKNTKDACSAKRSGEGQTQDNGVADAAEQNAGASHVYRVRAVDSRASADRLRGAREVGLEAIANSIKYQPTVSAFSANGASLVNGSIRSHGAVVLPKKHCAFDGCPWQGAAEAECRAHAVGNHAAVLAPVAAAPACTSTEDATQKDIKYWSVYNEAIAWKIRKGAPLAALAIDRPCLDDYARGLGEDAVSSLIFMVCARKFPFVEGQKGDAIQWQKVLFNGGDFFGLPSDFVRIHMSVDACVERFGEVSCDSEESCGVHLRDRPEEFDDWHVSVLSGDGPVKVLCCPEDLRCASGIRHSENQTCSRCEALLCWECRSGTQGPSGGPLLPPAALANDSMTFYYPEELFCGSVTVLEMICASVCVTSMVCFTLEKRCRSERTFDMETGNNMIRMAARGNATSFPMPWTDMLAQLSAAEDLAAERKPPSVPHTGAELAGIVSVIMKSGGDDDTAASMAKFVHQALVRRHVVVALIQGAKSRGHRAHRNVCMDAVRRKALELPENDVPAEIMRLAPLDDALEKIQMQKAATPVPRPDGLQEAADILDSTKGNAVVVEKSSFDEGDINSQRIEALRSFVQRLDEDCVHDGADNASSDSGDNAGCEEHAEKRARVREPEGAGDGPMKVLCCPEDMRCHSGTTHAVNSACTGCEAPLCGECGNAMAGPDGVRGAADILESAKTNAVVCEKSSFDEGDINAQRIEAVRTFVQRLDEECAHGDANGASDSSEEEGGDGTTERARKRVRVREGAGPGAEQTSREAAERVKLEQATTEGKRVDRLRVRTGNVMMDQFEPWYFGVAFAFLFKYCTGMPDGPEFMKRPRHRRGNGAPRVELPLWVRIMKRRVESQLCRDWHFGFVSWNLVFRSAVNLCRTWFTYVAPSATGEVEQLTPEQIGEGSKQIYRALDMKYVDINGRKQKVKGDMTKDPVHAAAEDQAQSRVAGDREWPRVAPDVDEESGDLYGFLPIAEGMPVALTDHIGRSEDKNLLRGRVGRVQSWVCDGDAEHDQVTRGGETILKKTPKVIFVLFDEGDDGKGGRKPCKWTTGGLRTPGLHPVAPQKKEWFVDKGRPHPRLKVKKASGQTFKGGVIVDLSIGGGTSPLSSYVALTRVQRREDMLIFRPFDIAPYQKKDERKGPGLLLRTLRGEDLDWEAIELEFMPSGRCAVCGCRKYKNMYPTVGQWSRADGLRVCSVCLEDKKRSGTPWQCMECGLWKCQEAFHASQHHQSKLTTRRCVDCPERRSCRVCEGRKYEEAFAPYQWDLAGNSRCRGGMCKECEELKKHLTCSRCGVEKLVDDFARSERNAEERKCKACKKSMREEERQRAEEGKQRVCSNCGESKSKAEFSAHMWCIASKETIACTQCVQDAAAQRDSAARKDVKACVVCEVAQRRDFFSQKMWNGVADRDRKCMRCVSAGAAQRNADARKDARACVVCEVAQRREYFSNWMWECAGDQHRKCKRCIDGAKLERGKWKCVECKGAFGREHYSNWLAGRSTQKANGKQRCNICCAGHERKRKEVAERTHASVTKKHKAG
ncbi:unnamed protein product [Prorocentrum cordatum]|uniref:USP domain-containing protein n=1 Tax=Prorocentrum cordatum TaxID=2364126 RepID=A0ABN9V1R7_9DINO|nr:unnamed protein product [Polarella glacialis]